MSTFRLRAFNNSFSSPYMVHTFKDIKFASMLVNESLQSIFRVMCSWFVCCNNKCQGTCRPAPQHNLVNIHHPSNHYLLCIWSGHSSPSWSPPPAPSGNTKAFPSQLRDIIFPVCPEYSPSPSSTCSKHPAGFLVRGLNHLSWLLSM